MYIHIYNHIWKGNGIRCYDCEILSSEDFDDDTCQDFSDSAPTKICPGTDYCINHNWHSVNDNFSVSEFDCDRNISLTQPVIDTTYCQNLGNGCHDIPVNQNPDIPDLELQICCCDSNL